MTNSNKLLASALALLGLMFVGLTCAIFQLVDQQQKTNEELSALRKQRVLPEAHNGETEGSGSGSGPAGGHAPAPAPAPGSGGGPAGVGITAEVNPEFSNSVRRKLIGIDTEQDRRNLGIGISQEEWRKLEIAGALVPAAFVDAAEAHADYAEHKATGVPISVTVEYNNVEYVELVSGEGVITKTINDDGSIEYEGLHPSGSATPKITLHCPAVDMSAGQQCDVYEEGDVSLFITARRRLSHCFSSVGMATVDGQGSTAMKDLKVGDKVLTGTGNFEPIYAMNHFNHDMPTEFLQLYTSNSAPLELTKNHMVFLHNKNLPVQAQTVKVGDLMIDVDGLPQEVVDIKSIIRNGFFAPFTADGTIVVDGMVASTYSGFKGKDYIEVAGVKVFHIHGFMNLVTPTWRVLCSLDSSYCEEHYDDGEGGYVSWAVKFCHSWESQNLLIKIAIFLFMTSAFVLFNPAAFGAVVMFGFMRSMEKKKSKVA